MANPPARNGSHHGVRWDGNESEKLVAKPNCAGHEKYRGCYYRKAGSGSTIGSPANSVRSVEGEGGQRALGVVLQHRVRPCLARWSMAPPWRWDSPADALRSCRIACDVLRRFERRTPFDVFSIGRRCGWRKRSCFSTIGTNSACAIYPTRRTSVLQIETSGVTGGRHAIHDDYGVLMWLVARSVVRAGETWGVPSRPGLGAGLLECNAAACVRRQRLRDLPVRG